MFYETVVLRIAKQKKMNKNNIVRKHIKTKGNIADISTKPLQVKFFKQLT